LVAEICRGLRLYDRKEIMSNATVCSEWMDWSSPVSAPGWSLVQRQELRSAEEAVERIPGDPYPDETAWLAKVQQGDEDAARALLGRLYPLVIKSVRCHRSKFNSEEDLAQAVFTKVFTKLHQYSGRVPLEHWVSRIAVNTCISQISREKVRPELRMSDLTESDQTMVERLLRTEDEFPGGQSRDAQALLEKLLACLKPEERLVITLLHLEERSTEEISQQTGWSVSRVKVKAFRARHKMRRVWRKLVKECQKTWSYGSACEL
jgi:RNA polymerase sigma factor (sigma-70 family)